MAERTDQENQSVALALIARGVTAQPAKRVEPSTTQRSTEAQVELTADYCRRFPGEPLTLFVQVKPQVDLITCGLELHISPGLGFINSVRLRGDGPDGPTHRTLGNDIYLSFDFYGGAAKGRIYEYALDMVVEATPADRTVETAAVLLARSDEDGPTIRDEEMLGILVSAKSNYIRFLPSLYTQDELMGRFLMLFESFFSPISQQIRQIPYYFDPAVAPMDMVTWLASWLDRDLDTEWPEAQRRSLLKSAGQMDRKRGTAKGLREYLEIYTGGEVQIIEHRADNFVVRNWAELGGSIALGRDNRPHTFTVIVRMPPDMVSDSTQEDHWQRRISAIIDQEKPVHTTYTLQIEAAQ